MAADQTPKKSMPVYSWKKSWMSFSKYVPKKMTHQLIMRIKKLMRLAVILDIYSFYLSLIDLIYTSFFFTSSLRLKVISLKIFSILISHSSWLFTPQFHPLKSCRAKITPSSW